jgi:hypothetical protein
MSVYCVQMQHRFDTVTERLVPKYDLSAAADYGDIQYLLSPTASPFRPDSVLADLHHKLAEFGDDDYLLLMGNPCLIGMAVAVAAGYNEGNVKMLQWSGKDQRYIAVDAEGILPI